VVDVGGAVDHGDHGDHCLQPAGGLHLAPEEKLVALSHEEKSGRCCLFLAVQQRRGDLGFLKHEAETVVKVYTKKKLKKDQNIVKRL
jgi:hypothetical protein